MPSGRRWQRERNRSLWSRPVSNPSAGFAAVIRKTYEREKMIKDAGIGLGNQRGLPDWKIVDAPQAVSCPAGKQDLSGGPLLAQNGRSYQM
jgi:hypothetical protein